MTNIRYALLCLVVGCIPPTDTYPSQSWSQGSPQPQYQQAPNGYGASQNGYQGAPNGYGDTYDDNSYDGAPSNTPAQPGSPPSGHSHAHHHHSHDHGRSNDQDDSQDVDYDPAATGTGYGRGNGNGGSRGGGGRGRTWWMCTAEASLGTAIGDGPMNYRVKSAVNNGPTKQEAATKALKDCGAIVGAAMAIDGGDSRHEGGTCEISQCISGQ